MHTEFKVKNYFKDWKNVLTFLCLLALVAAGIFLRIRNLGYLAFWGDDGHTFIGTISILNHGYPLLPSGNILWHGILGYYLDVIPVLIFGNIGTGEFAFRITSVFFGVATIVLIYFVGKDLANRYVGFLSAFLITFSSWYIYFSREVRYYSTLQFFFLLSFYFFYRGFIKNNKKFTILATVFICLTPLVHGIGFLLLLLFVPLLFYLGRKFFRTRILIPLAIIFAFDLLQVVNQVFFWKVGRSFFAASSGLRSTLAAYLKAPDPFYFKILEIMFPEMFIIISIGILIFISFAIFVSIRQTFTYSSINLSENEIKLKRLRLLDTQPSGTFGITGGLRRRRGGSAPQSARGALASRRAQWPAADACRMSIRRAFGCDSQARRRLGCAGRAGQPAALFKFYNEIL